MGGRGCGSHWGVWIKFLASRSGRNVDKQPISQSRQTVSPWISSNTRRRSCSPSTTCPPPPGRVTDTAEGAKAIAEEIGKPVMVKAQVKVGGRGGKAGGVKYAATPDDAFTHAQNILGLDIKGHVVKKLLVAEASDIAEEYYISFLLDRSNRTYLAMCSVEGGMEIEEVAATKPERLAKVPVDAVKGVDLAFARLDRRAGPPARRGARRRRRDHPEAVGVFVGEDATLVEVNPLVRTPPDDQILRWTARSPSTPTPTSVSPGTRSSRTRTPRTPPRAEGQGERPQLRQARRLGRHHRQRRGPGDVDPRRRRVRR